MSLSFFRHIPGVRTACAVAALALGAAASAHAQPYEDGYYDDGGPTVGTIIVTPEHRRVEHSFNGAPIVTAHASRVVDISDLDLSTGYGVHELHRRVSRAALDACSDLDMAWTQGLYPTADDSDAACYHRAVNRAMRAAPISYDEGY